MEQKPSSATSLNFLEQLKRTRIRAGENAAAMPDLTGRIIFDRVTVGKAVHDGGESRLYRAVAGDGTELAVKQYRRKDPVKPEVLARLQAVSSPHVGKILAAGEVEGSFVTVMPFYEGMSLREALRQGGRFSDGEILDQLLPPVLDALHSIHEAGILHRDLKPDNIILCVQDQRVVLVDFGIASSAGDGTVVVTETGNTPLYSAPETFAGAWLRESDYYSLGITLYELATGVTPYQSSFLTPEELRRYAMVSRIPYPNDFPERLRHLIDGLTYKDITRRHDLDSPDRRWGYEEVACFLRGEDVPVPGTGDRTSSGSQGGDPGNGFSIPYPYKGRKYGNSHDLAIALLTDWDGGKKEMMRELLADHYELLGMNTVADLCRNTVRDVETGKTDEDVAFFRLMYSLGKPISGIYWKEFFFESLQDYGNKLIDAATAESAWHNDSERVESGQKNAETEIVNGSINQHSGLEAIRLMETVSQLLINGLLRHYVIQTETSVKEDYSRIVELNFKVLREKPLDTLHNALRLGYNITGRSDFVLGNRHYSMPSELNSELDVMNQKDIIGYVTFCQRHWLKARNLVEVLPPKASQELSSHFLSPSKEICLYTESGINNSKRVDIRTENVGIAKNGISAIHFRNYKDLLRYEEALFENRYYARLYAFREAAKSDYTKKEVEIRSADAVLYAKNQNRFYEMVCINGVVYPTVEEFVNYYQYLKDYELPKMNEFISATCADIITTWQESRLERVRRVLKKHFSFVFFGQNDGSCFILSQLLNGNGAITFGKYRFGNYTVMKPIKWRVLALENNSLLLISEFGIDTKLYSENKKLTWAESSLRKWLNDDFLRSAFNGDERSLILEHKNNNYSDPTTDDLVFLLSNWEAEVYFANSVDRRCKPSILVKNRGASFCSSEGYCQYWLRTTHDSVYRNSNSGSAIIFRRENEEKDRIYYVDYDGTIKNISARSNYCCVVRPALWLSINLIKDSLKEFLISCREDIVYTPDKTQIAKVSAFLNEHLPFANIISYGDIPKPLAYGQSRILFGNYWVMNDKVRQPIEWRVLFYDDEKVLLITEYGINVCSYHNQVPYVSWNDCSLRKWLNEVFLIEAFNEKERDMILKLGSKKGNDLPSEDKVFLLNEEEATNYFKNCDDIRCKPTPYAKSRGADSSKDGYGYFWLRDSDWGGLVFPEGEIMSTGDLINAYMDEDYNIDHDIIDDKGMVRPALFLSLKI